LLRRDIVILAWKPDAYDGGVVGPGRARSAEVDNFSAVNITVRNKHIVRRHIPMDDVVPVRLVKRGGYPLLQLPYLIEGKLSSLNDVRQPLATDKLPSDYVGSTSGVPQIS
jgi:hypothetical protein